jgi:propionyl-CoA synthetase
MPGYYNTGDSGFKDHDGYFHVMSREDDVINTAGHRLSTGEMEEILMKHPQIAEAIVIGVVDEIKGEIPTAFVTIKTEHLKTYDAKTVAKESVALIREHIGPVASFKHCFVVPRLPKTRSGKYLRNIVRKIFNKQKYEVPSTIEDMEVVF